MRAIQYPKLKRAHPSSALECLIRKHNSNRQSERLRGAYRRWVVRGGSWEKRRGMNGGEVGSKGRKAGDGRCGINGAGRRVEVAGRGMGGKRRVTEEDIPLPLPLPVLHFLYHLNAWPPSTRSNGMHLPLQFQRLRLQLASSQRRSEPYLISLSKRRVYEDGWGAARTVFECFHTRHLPFS